MESILLLLTLLVLSFIFSGYETAFFSIPAGEREHLSIKYPYLNIQTLQDDRTTLLNVLLLMNLLVNTMNSFVFARVIESLSWINRSSDIILLYQIGGFFIILLLFGEITPKVIAIRNPAFFLKNFSVFIFTIYRLLGWIIRPISFQFKFLFSKLWHKEVSPESTLMELKTLFPDVPGVFTGISIARGNVRRFIRHRRHVVHLEDEMSVEEIDRVIKKQPHSLYPVLSNNEIVKVANMLKSSKSNIYFEEPAIIPDTITILDYLRDVDEEINGFRVVVSEHGEYIGIATLDDLIKVLSPETNIKRVNERVFIVDGRSYIEDIESKLGVTFDTDSDTIMGYIMEKTERIPEEGERFEIDGVRFEVLSREEGEIKLVRMEIL